ncbi:TPA: cell envelope integrity protein TolA [Corynebacterium striatum]|nr:cell envelope integrity protein TolA [Corynebacterium striatum]
MRSRLLICVLGLGTTLCVSCTTHETTPVAMQEDKTARPTTSSATAWDPGAAPQPITRLAPETSATTAPEVAAPNQELQSAENALGQGQLDQEHLPQAHTVTVRAPAPAPGPAFPQMPKLPEFPVPALPPPPKIPTAIPLPPEVQGGIDQIPKPPPLPRPEDIYIPLPH